MWPVERREEFKMLETLLNECLRINSATNIIDRLAKINEFANLLTKTDFVKPDDGQFQHLVRESFSTFLHDEAMKR